MNTLILVLSLVAGIVGTGLGGVIGVLLKNKGNKIMGRVLSFAGGVMVGVVTFEMLPEAIEYSKIENAIEQSGILIAVAALLVGMLVIFGLNKLLDVIENMRDTHRSIEELHHETKVIEANDALNADAVATVKTQEVDKKSLLKAGIIMLLAIALHNLPEGMAIGATGASDTYRNHHRGAQHSRRHGNFRSARKRRRKRLENDFAHRSCRRGNRFGSSDRSCRRRNKQTRKRHLYGACRRRDALRHFLRNFAAIHTYGRGQSACRKHACGYNLLYDFRFCVLRKNFF